MCIECFKLRVYRTDQCRLMKEYPNECTKLYEEYYTTDNKSVILYFLSKYHVMFKPNDYFKLVQSIHRCDEHNVRSLIFFIQKVVDNYVTVCLQVLGQMEEESARALISNFQILKLIVLEIN